MSVKNSNQQTDQQNIFELLKISRSNLLIWLIIVLAILLRFTGLGTESYWIDEIATTIEARQSIVQILTIGKLDQPPAYNLPVHYWLQAFGDSEVSLRSFSALAGLGSIILIYLIGCRLFSKEVGLLSALFMVLSDFQIFISQEARNYSLFELTILLSFLFFIEFIQTKRIAYLGLYTVASIIMVNSNAFGVFVIVGQNLYFLLQEMKSRKAILNWAISQILIVLGVVPYLAPLILGDAGVEGAITSNVPGVPPPVVSDLFRTIYRFLLPPRRYFGVDMKWSGILLMMYLGAGLIFLFGVVVHVIRLGTIKWFALVKEWGRELMSLPELKKKLILLGCWLVCPLVLPFLISKLILPVYSHKYVIGAAPAFYLLLSLGLFSFRKVVPLWVSLVAFMPLVIPGITYYYVSDIKEQWRETAEFVEASDSGADVILFAPNEYIGVQQYAFYYYYQGELPGCGVGPDSLSDVEVENALNRCVPSLGRFWVIIRNSSITDNRYQSFFINPGQPYLNLLVEKQFIGISAYLFEFR